MCSSGAVRPVGGADLGKGCVVTVERALRLIAGVFVILSVLLGIYVNANFLWFTVFVGANLFQSAFTAWCPMMAILRKAGLSDTARPGHALTGVR